MATSSTEATVSQSNTSVLKRHFMDKLMNNICCFYDEQSLIDVKFKVPNPQSFVPAHRLILAAASPYFKNLFNGDRGNTPVIEINDIESDIFERLITFCYTGQTLLNVDNVAAMLKAAIVLQLEDAATACVEFLMAHIDECTLQCVYAVERETQYELLKQEIHQYEIENFNEISQSEEFLNFDVEKLQCLLELHNLKITCEEDAYNAITRWCNHDVSARREHLPRLIACLRLTQFDVHFLLSHIQSLPGCELLALQASMWIRDPAARAMINIRFTEARVAYETTLLAVYYNDNLENPCIMQYNKAEDKWEEYASIEYRARFNFRTILKEDNILFIGGLGENYESFNTVISWSIRNKTWRELPAMNQARDSHCVVEFDGKIYAIGGQNDGNTLQSVERYTTSNGWEFVKPLITARWGGCAVTFNGKIYVMGGEGNRMDSLTSVECYNPDSCTWTSCADMALNYMFPCAAAHNGFIYVAGDLRGNRAVERYDPQRNTWSKICSLEGEWCGRAFAYFDNKLWTIGGRVGRDNEIRVAVYNEDGNCWIQKSSLPGGVIFSCFIVPLSLLSTQ